jgi:adenosylcobinamide amidohydrolase
VPDSYARVDIDRHIAEVAATLELHGDGVGMLTAARVRRYQSFADQGVDVAVTVGLSHPTWASSNETLSNQPIGTINIVCFLPVRLENGALLNALTTATEAKSQALWDAAIPGTGTASDAICIFCPLDAEVAVFAGPRSQWGSRLARTVYRSVLAGAQAPVS